MNFFWKYFLYLKVSYTDDITTKFYYDICQLAKATKLYNWISRPWLIIKYSKIYINLIRFITLYGFEGKKYFFMFTDGVLWETNILLEVKNKNDLDILKSFILEHKQFLIKNNLLI